VLLLLLWGSAAPAVSDPPPVTVPGESRETTIRLEEARWHLGDGKWADSIEELQGILDSGGNDLVRVAVPDRPALTRTTVAIVGQSQAGPCMLVGAAPLLPALAEWVITSTPVLTDRSVRARWLVHAEIAALPPEARRLYRNRIDRQAEQWLEQGAANLDVRLLRKVVEEAFCSTAAEKALDLLGDLAFERGRFEEARVWWAMLVRPLCDSDITPIPGECIYPEPASDPARVHAKQLLATLFARGRTPAWEADLARFRTAHPKATGGLAGATGTYADLLAGLAQQRSEEPLPDPDWSSFGGAPSRGLVVPAADALEEVSALVAEGPTWTIPLPAPDTPPDPARPLPVAMLNRACTVHPVITPTHVVFSDGRRITAINYRTGQPSTWYTGAPFKEGLPPKFGWPAGVRWTMTAAGGRVYARLGTRGLQPLTHLPTGRAAPPAGPLLSVLAGLNLPPAERPEDNASRRWRLSLDGADPDRPTYFEGAPLALNNRVYFAVSRFSGDEVKVSLECWTDESEPVLCWRRDICEGREARPDEPRFQHHLLTHAGHLLVYCSHMGLIVAVDALSGHNAWAVRYPRHEEEGDDGLLEVVPSRAQLTRARDVAPVVFADGRLYAAPADSDSLLCMDLATGQVLWEREGLRVVQLLGVGQGRLIFTTTSGLRAVGAVDGSDANGWALPDTGTLPPMGRGILIGDLVLWPTVRWRPGGARGHVVYVVRQADGRLAAEPSLLHRLPAGNLACAHGCLAVADRDTVSIFVRPQLLLEDRRRTSREGTGSADAWLALGRAEADAHHWSEAAAAFLRAEDSGTSSAARQRRQAALLAQGRAALTGRTGDRLAQAEVAFRDAMALEVPLSRKLSCMMSIADLWRRQGESARALAVWEQVLSTPELREQPAWDDCGLPASASVLAAAAARDLCSRSEELAKRAHDRVKGLWEAAAPQERLEVAERLVAECPHAAFTRTALQQLARELEQAKRPGAAAWAWRKVLALRAADEEQAAALVGLGRTLEQQNCPESASEVWRKLQRLHGGRIVAEAGPRPIAEIAAEALHRLGKETRSAGVALPWRRRWHAPLGPSEAFLPGADPEACPALIFTATGATVTARQLATGEVAWRYVLPFTPTWAAVEADLALLAGPQGIACLRCEDGGTVWGLPAPRRDQRFLDVPVAADPHYLEGLDGFRLAGGRLFFVQGRRRLFALSAESGQALWGRWAPGAALGEAVADGQFYPLYQAGPSSLLVQTSIEKWWLLDAATGRTLREGLASKVPWPEAPAVLDGQVLCFAPVANEVLALDTDSGRDRWAYRVPGRSLSTGEPCHIISGGKEVLIVLSRNTGYYLERLAADTGRPVWKRPCPLPGNGLERESWAVDAENVYQAQNGTLTAWSLENGHTVWEQPLPRDYGWSVRRGQGGLVVCPAVMPRRHCRFQWPGAAIQYLNDRLPAGQTEFPLLVCDPRTGELTERLNFPAVPRARWTVDGPGEFSVWTGVLGAARSAVYTGPGLGLVAIGGGVWGIVRDE
jgi:outer membrane protein assembly factor BamB